DAPRDIVVRAKVESTTGNIDLTADSDGSGTGGVWIDEAPTPDAKLSSAAGVSLTGSDLITGHTGTQESTLIDADGTNNQIEAAGNVTLQRQTANVPVGADVVIDGHIKTTAGGGITVNAEDTSGEILLGANLTAAAKIDLQDPVSLTGGVTLAANDIDFDATLDGGFDLVLADSGTTTFTGAVGGTTPIGDGVDAAITINSTGTTEFVSTLRTREGIVQANGAGVVTLRQDVDVLEGDTGSNFQSGVVLDGLTFTSAGTVTLGSATANEDGLTISGALVTIDTSAANKQVTVNADTDLSSPLTISTGSGKIELNGTIDGNHAVNLDSTGTTDINGVIGGDVAVASLTTNAGGTTEIGANISAQGSTQTYNDPVTLTANVSLTDSGGGITFEKTVNSDATSRSLAINAPSGNVTFKDDVGTSAALVSLDVQNAQVVTLDDTDTNGTAGINIGSAAAVTQIIINSTLDTTDGDAALNAGAVNLNSDNIDFGGTVTIDTDDDGTDGTIAIGATSAADIDATAAGVQGLNIRSGDAAVTIRGDVGSNVRLGAVDIDSTSGTVAINGDVFTRNGEVNFEGVTGGSINVTANDAGAFQIDTDDNTDGTRGGDIVFGVVGLTAVDGSNVDLMFDATGEGADLDGDIVLNTVITAASVGFDADEITTGAITTRGGGGAGNSNIDLNATAPTGTAITLNGDIIDSTNGGTVPAGQINLTSAGGRMLLNNGGNLVTIRSDGTTDAGVTISAPLDAAGGEPLTINAGTDGDVDLNRPLGAAAGGEIGLTTIDARNLDIDANFEGAGLRVTAQSSVEIDSTDTGGSVTIDMRGIDSSFDGPVIDADNGGTSRIISSIGAAPNLLFRSLAPATTYNVGDGAGGVTTDAVAAVEGTIGLLEIGYDNAQFGNPANQSGTINFDGGAGGLTANTNFTVQAGGATVNITNGITLTGAGDALTINGANATTNSLNTQTIRTNEGQIGIHDSVRITAGTTLTLDTENDDDDVGADAFVTGSITATGANANLIVDAGNGAMTFGTAGNGNVIGSAGTRLGDATATTAGNVTLHSTVNAQSLTLNGPGGDARFNRAINLDDGGAGDALDINNKANVTFADAAMITTANSGAVNIDGTSTGTLTIGDGNLDLDGSFTEGQFNAVSIGADIDTTNDNVTFGDPVVLTDSIDLNTTGATGGNIHFMSTVGTVGNNLDLDAGPAGDVTVGGALSGGGNLTVRDGKTQSYQTMTVDSFDIQDATTSVTLDGAVNVTGAADVDVDIDGGAAATFTANGTITAGSFALDGTGTDDVFNFNKTVDTNDAATGAITISHVSNVIFADDADVTAETSLTIQNVSTEVQLGTNVDFTAEAGDVDINNTVTLIELAGTGANIISARGSDIELAAITDSGAVDELEINADGSITIDTIVLDDQPDVLLDVNLDENGGGGTFTGNTLQAGRMTFDGTGTDDVFNFDGTVETTDSATGTIVINRAGNVNFAADADVTAETNLTVQNVAAEVQLGTDVDLLAQAGDVDINNAVTLIDLAGTGINRITANGSDIELAAVSDSGAVDEFELNADDNITLDSVILDDQPDVLLDVNVDVDGGVGMLIANALQAGQMTIDGTGTNDPFNFNDKLETTDPATGTIVISNASNVNFGDGIGTNDDVTAETSLTIQNVSNQVDLDSNADLSAENGALLIATNVNRINLSGTTGTNNVVDGNGDAVVDLVKIVGTSPDSLTINGEGSVTLDTVDINSILNVNFDNDNDTQNAQLAANRIDANEVNIDGGNDDNDDASFSTTITADTADISFNDVDVLDLDGTLTAATDITATDISTRIDLAGNVNLTAQAGDVDAGTDVKGIFLSGSGATTNVVTATGGSVDLGPVTDSSPSLFQINADTDIITSSIAIANVLDVNLQDAGPSTLNAGGPWTAGTVTLDGAQTGGADDDTFNFASTVSSTTAGITIRQASVLDFDGDVTAANTLLIDEVATKVDLAQVVDLVATVGNTTIDGPIDLSGATGINRITSVAGNVDLQEPLTDSGTPAELEINSAGNVTAVSTAISNLLDINSDTDDNQSGSIEATGTLGAGTADLNAATGIGNASVLSTAVASFDDIINDTSGNININNSLASDVTVDELSLAGGGNITFSQSGGGSISFTTVSTAGDGTPADTEDNIMLANTGGDLIIGGNSVTADGKGDIRYTTLTSGDIRLAGSTTAFDDDVTITAAGAVLDGDASAAQDIFAADLVVRAGSGIGTSSNPLETQLQNGGAAGHVEANGGAGGVHLVNTGDLVVGGIGAGLVDTNGDPVAVTANGGGIGIEVMSNLDVDSPIRELGGGDIGLTASADLTVKNSVAGKMASELEVVGAGRIRVTAGGIVSLTAPAGEYVIVRTATGEIVNVPAVLAVTPIDHGGSHVTSGGFAEIDVTVGDPADFAEENFRIVNDWNDFPGNKPIDDHPIPGNAASNPAAQHDAGTHRFSHTYSLGNPDPKNPAAKIPVDVTVRYDPRPGSVIEAIEFSAAGFKIETTVRVELTVPGEGLIAFIKVEKSEVVPVELRRSGGGYVIASQASSASQESNAFEMERSEIETTLVTDLRVLFRRVDAAGKEGDDVDLPVEVLEGMLEDVFQKFPNGFYRVYLQEAGSERVRSVRDVHVYQGRVVTSDFRENVSERQPGGDQETAPKGEPVEATPGDAKTAPPKPPADDTTASATPDGSSMETTPETDEAAASVKAGVAVGAGLGAYAMRGRWADQVDRAFEAGPHSLSTAARLYRRIRRKRTRH
ncbi:MAG: hypothetical protein ISR77_34115, partial [Pirellulaceae bacterium]|nr:hypothetical protein [Pirellulaceae bacterium]